MAGHLMLVGGLNSVADQASDSVYVYSEDMGFIESGFLKLRAANYKAACTALGEGKLIQKKIPKPWKETRTVFVFKTIIFQVVFKNK